MPEETAALLLKGATKAFRREQEGGSWLRRLGLGRRAEPNANGKQDRSVVAVDHVDLLVRPREIFGILGANGSGKSTLIRLVSTLLLPDSGQVTVFGYDVVRDEMQVKRLISRVSV